MTLRTSTWRLLAVVSCSALSVVLSSHPAGAHGQPVNLAFWGGYPSGVARCQRAIARASARCMNDTVAARQACLTPVLAGGTCNTTDLNSTIATLRQRALNMVAPECSSLQLQQLYYADISDAYRDIVDACRRMDTAVTSAVYAPAIQDSSVRAVEDPARSCIEAAATASAKLLDFSVRARLRAFDRIASVQMAPANKQRLVARGGEQIARVRAELQSQITERCAPADFTAAYHREMDAYLVGVSAQAGCHAQYVYVQNEVLCPEIECGNGIQEPNEQCDDGNAVESDGCLNTCQRGTCTDCAP